jgi:hypothetical protein
VQYFSIKTNQTPSVPIFNDDSNFVSKYKDLKDKIKLNELVGVSGLVS